MKIALDQHDGGLWYDWICGECLKVARGAVSAGADGN